MTMNQEYLGSLFSLAGKTVLVTGGAKGIGHMIAQSLVKAGATVYIASRSTEDCARVAKELSAYGVCRAIPADLSTMEGIHALVDKITTKENSLDVLVNNSGKTWGASLEEYPESAWDSVMTLNVKSPFYLVQKLLPLLEKSATADDPARIINIGSISALTSETLNAYAYVASKAAIHQLTRALARDLVLRHINVNAIAPGFFPSKMTRHYLDDGALKEQLSMDIPMRRMGRPDEIGALAIYLASSASAFMTGNILALDGGYLVGE